VKFLKKIKRMFYQKNNNFVKQGSEKNISTQNKLNMISLKNISHKDSGFSSSLSPKSKESNQNQVIQKQPQTTRNVEKITLDTSKYSSKIKQIGVNSKSPKNEINSKLGSIIALDKIKK